VNTPGGNISKLVANFPNFHFAEVDGTDPIASYEAMVEAVAYCRAGKGPALVHGHVIRPYSHSLSDDERLYRSAEELETDAARDPISRMQMWLLREGILDADAINKLEQQVDEEVQRAADRAVMATLPTLAYRRDTGRPDPMDARCDRAGSDCGSDGGDVADPTQRCLKDEMRRDERIVVFGEDVADDADKALREGKARQGWGVQADGRTADGVWQREVLQLSAGRSEYRGPRDWHGGARVEAGGGDSVLRLHLAGDAPDAQ
jgi:2-oxoisovalerate dehydrogenase E1 component